MTESEYRILYQKAFAGFRRAIRNGNTEIRQIYIDASKLVSEAVRTAELSGLSELTTRSLANIQLQLEASAGIIRVGSEEAITNHILGTTQRFTAIDERYLLDAINLSKSGISKTGVSNLFVSVDERILTSLFSRTSQAGYTFSESVWNAGLDYQIQMKRVIDLGFSQGRDILDIAKDLDEYVADGKQRLIKRIGKLKRGTSEFAKRIRQKVDYRSFRILRSEMYASMQDVSKFNGQYNPGASGLYDWFRTLVEDFDCVCPKNEADNPHTLENVPGFPHSNCSCVIRPRLRPQKQFIEDLTRWSNGESVGYLDDWNMKYFQFATVQNRTVEGWHRISHSLHMYLNELAVKYGNDKAINKNREFNKLSLIEASPPCRH